MYIFILIMLQDEILNSKINKCLILFCELFYYVILHSQYPLNKSLLHIMGWYIIQNFTYFNFWETFSKFSHFHFQWFNDQILQLIFCRGQCVAQAASLAKRSACLTTNHEIVGSIPGTFTVLYVDCIWNGVHPALRGQLGSYLIEKQWI